MGAGLKLETLSGMASFAIRKIVSSENPFVVMTARASLPVRGRKMHRSKRLGDLAAAS